MKAKHATQIRRGILIALIGSDLDFKNEEPLTIDAYLRTAAKVPPRKSWLEIRREILEKGCPCGYHPEA